MARQRGGFDALDAIALGACTCGMGVMLQGGQQLRMVGSQVLAVDDRFIAWLVAWLRCGGRH
ncbi:hypothetical protein D3C85_1706650 [compost metagenome]